MDPIISPWTVFWAQALMNLDGFNHFAFLFILFLDVIWAVLYIGANNVMNEVDSYIEIKELDITPKAKATYLKAEKDLKILNKIKIPLIILTVFSVLCIIFIPSKEMMIAIIASSYVTPDNINTANEVFKTNLNDYVNIIANAIKK